MGKKYIIELEDKPFHNGNGDFLYRVKGFNSLVFDMTGVGKLTPYTEPDLEQVRKEAYEQGYENGFVAGHLKAEKSGQSFYEDGYNRGLADAWEAARTLWNTPNRKEIFGHTTFNTGLITLTAQEAIEKIRQYEQEKEESVTTVGVMRQYLDTFCKGRICNGCPLNTPDFTCCRGHHFITLNPTSNEEVRRAYAKVLQKMKEE